LNNTQFISIKCKQGIFHVNFGMVIRFWRVAKVIKFETPTDGEIGQFHFDFESEEEASKVETDLLTYLGFKEVPVTNYEME